MIEAIGRSRLTRSCKALGKTLASIAAVGVLATTGCRETRDLGEPGADAGRVLVVGIDGADPEVLRQLWKREELPNLRQLADRGVFGILKTDYGQSPVVWTTLATGRLPKDHGITGFQIDTPQGRFHASTRLRRAPALWNILTRAGRRTAVLGWWPSWPAEPINGVVVTDRAGMPLENRVWPPEFLARWQEIVAAAEQEESSYPWGDGKRIHDRAILRAARELAHEAFALTLVYVRDIDITSHRHWDTWRPEDFGSERSEAVWNSPVPSLYRALDRELGRLLEAYGPETDVFIVSDHGFRAATDDSIRINLDLPVALEKLGLLIQNQQASVDCESSSVIPVDTVPANPTKELQLCPGRDLDEVRALLAERLGEVTYAGGLPVFSLRGPTARERQRRTDLVVEVLQDGASSEVLVAGERRRDIVRVSSVPGDHGPSTHGIFLAAGPDIEAGSPIDGISIHDLASTVLYALGMPVAEDSSGRAWTELFTEEFQKGHRLRTVSSWGSRTPGDAEASPVDQELTEELRALGYL